MNLQNITPMPCPDFLPVTKEEAEALGYKLPLDFVFVTGDAYVDHPSFGAAIIGKLLTSFGYTVGIIAQPDMKNNESFQIFGLPRLAFFVTSGNVDSMVNHYTAAKKRRSNDYYSPGNKAGLRPDRAVTAYGRKIRECYGYKKPIVLGGLEASLRRLAHYDYWSDSVRKAILIDSKSDILVYGMGERAVVEIAEALAAEIPVSAINYIQGTVYRTSEAVDPKTITLPAFEQVSTDKKTYAESFRIQYENTNYLSAEPLCENYGDCYIVQNPPAKPLTTDELDYVYGLNFARKPHFCYNFPIPAIEEVRFSITSARGCYGGCGFCALSFHQGRAVSSRSHESILKEAELITEMTDFKGYIHDVGGPTANFRKPSCKLQEKHGVCKNKRCLAPEPCKNLNVDHSDLLSLLRKIRTLPKVKKVFIRSGIRFDYLMLDKNTEFFEELCEHHISGQLKVAPEHVSKGVLKRMGKSYHNVYAGFIKKYNEINIKLGKKQFVVPYLMSSHPGSGLNEAIELAEYLRDNHIAPEQVQDFYPTPGTISTCMYYTGIDPLTGDSVFTAKLPRDKAMQRALIQYRLPQNKALVRAALQKAERADLIGFGKQCLLRPEKGEKQQTIDKQKSHKNEKPKKKKTIRNIHKKK